LSNLDSRAVIARSPWFEGLPDSALDRLATAAVIKDYPVSSYIYAMGQATTEIYGVVSGRVRVSISGPQGQEFAVVDFEHDAWLGEPGLVGDEARILDARVMVPSQILCMPRKVVLDVGEKYPLMYRNLFHHQMKNTRGLYEIISGILFYPLRVRVAGRLLHLLAEHGQEVEGGTMIDIKLSQNDFARLALGSRQRVNMVFRDWNERGLVETRDDHLLIRDIEALQRELDPQE
jgi:CRP/FNR family cyclic AMP-dependent transcriptional regulator